MTDVAAISSEAIWPILPANGISSLLSGTVVLPFTAAVTALLHIDMRIRREARDIELVAAGGDPGDPLAPYRDP